MTPHSDPQVRSTAASRGEYGRLHGMSYWLALVLGSVGIVLAINQTFNLRLLGFSPIGTSFYYLLIATFLTVAFMAYPGRRRDAQRIPWFDWVLMAVTVADGGYLAWNGLNIIEQGWDIAAPPLATFAAGVLCLLALEGVRRCAGLPLLIICSVFFAYPLYADYMPGFLWGTSYSFLETLRAHAMGVESIIGVPMRVVADLVVGYLVFGTALTVTGGGEFFMDFATALMGKSRGGPAKVSVVSSGFFGSLSGSVISNVLTTGSMTIPTMKRAGYSAEYAGAVEACASTGGALMPPVMGTVAFIMASFLNVPYATIMVAAFLPALLFYVALLFQVDNHAARRGLKGLPPEEIPDLGRTLMDGWPYLFSLAMLVYMLLFMRIESFAPYYATAVLLVVALLKPRKRLRLNGLLLMLVETARNIGNLVAILAGVGLIVGGLSYTGVGGAFSRELIQYAEGSVPLMLLFGAATSFVLGMGMTVSACYIFLAILLAPMLVDSGLNPLASHLFILYWGMMSYITPPVALAAVTASGISGANALATGLRSMRLGSILFVLPFLFVTNPNLILQGRPVDIFIATVTALIAVWLLASAFEGYLYRVGPLGWGFRAVVLVAAGMLLFPETNTDGLGLALLVAMYGYWYLVGRRRLKAHPAPESAA
ncbi:MAG: TRAP transporter permease [Candidatus Lambdaproteobacteria bacterium]|nr:TRAP transporter permease [Candidatus Lambdaproteobacteria bacterium]